MGQEAQLYEPQIPLLPGGAQRWIISWSLDALLPLVYTTAPAPYLCTWVLSPTQDDRFSSLALVPISFLVILGSPWPRILPCSCLLPSPCLATAPAKTRGQSRAICEQASQTPSAPFILGAVPAQTLRWRSPVDLLALPKTFNKPLARVLS